MLLLLSGVKVVAVAAGQQHSLALSDKGEVFSWGCGSYGSLGLGLGERGGGGAGGEEGRE